MIASGMQTDAEVGAEERGAEFGNQLLYCVGARTEPAGEIAVEPHGVPGPVYEFMEQDRVERSGWGAGNQRARLMGFPIAPPKKRDTFGTVCMPFVRRLAPMVAKAYIVCAVI